MTKNNNPYNRDELIRFPLNKLEYIFIEPPYKDIDSLSGFEHPSENPSWFYRGPNNLTLRITGGCWSWIDHELDDFISHLQSALDGNLELNTNILHNLGYQWNEQLYSRAKNKGEWEGRRYLCFGDIKVETFIYTINTIIYLEIIPTYPWLFGDKPKGIKRVPFKEFLKTYKPYVRTIVSQEAAKKSLVTAEFLRNIIDQNQQNIIANSRRKET